MLMGSVSALTIRASFSAGANINSSPAARLHKLEHNLVDHNNNHWLCSVTRETCQQVLSFSDEEST